MPEGSGTSLGTATGRVVITAETSGAEAQLNSFAQKTERLGKQIAGAFGIDLGIRGAIQLGQAAIEADKVATAYNRQRVAAESLAGSQAELNVLLDTYDKATGGILDKSQELAAVTKLMAVGFADSSAELSKFATAIRGISIAMGTSQDTITQNLILELFSQRGQRLDQLGLQYDKVRQRADELRAADGSLTQQQAYQNAVLDEATKKFGGLATSSEGAITGIEALEKAWSNLRLELAQELHPGLDEFFKETAAGLEWIRQRRAEIPSEAENLFRGAGINRTPAWMTGVSPAASGPLRPQSSIGDSADIDKAWSDHFDKVADIERQASNDILSENTSYQNRRLRSEESYQESVARSAADFAKGRMRAQEDYENSILDIMRQAQQRDARMAEDHARELARMQSDSAKRLGDLQEDLDRNNAQKRIDSADKVAEMAADADGAIADKRQDSTDRLLDIEKDYARQQEDAARTHQTNRLEAAARLDARALFFEDRRFNDEQQKAADAQQDKVDDEKDKLQKSLDNINESYNEKLQDEQRALDKSIRQANEAHDRQVKDEQEALQTRIDDANEAYERQLADAKAADAQRITDMAAHFAEQKRRENEDQIDRMGRMASDHTDEMTQMDTEHGERITQIGDHAKEERTALDAEFRHQLSDLGVHNAAYDKAEAQHKEQIRLSQAIFQEEEKRQLADAQIAMLNILKLNPFLSPEQVAALNTATIALNQSVVTYDTNIGLLNGQLAALPKNPYIFGPTATTNTVTGSELTGAAMVGVSTLPAAAGGNSLAVSFAQGAIVVYGAPGQSVEGLADIIDARILRTVQMAAGRI